MSLVVALRGSDGMVLAADSRVTEGYTLLGPTTRDDSVKILKLTEETGLLTYGLMEVGFLGITTLRDAVSTQRESPLPLEALLEAGRETFTRVSEAWGEKNTDVRRRENDVGFILAGLDRGRSQLRIFRFESPDFSPRELRSDCVLAGEWHIARFITAHVPDVQRSPEELGQLAVLLLDATMSVAKTVGGAVMLASLTPAQGFRWSTAHEIAVARAKNHELTARFRECFLGSLARAARTSCSEFNTSSL